MDRTIRASRTEDKVLEMVFTGLSIALIYVATLIQIEIPTPNGGGLVHLGTAMSLIITLVFGRKIGAVSGATAMGLFDILSKYTLWAPTTIITRLIMGLIVGTIATKDGKTGASFTRNLIAIVAGGVWMIAGYFIGEGLTFGNWITPFASIGGNALQVIVGGAAALAFVPAIRKANPFR